MPIGATAVVTALTAGGFVVADLRGSPTTTAAGDTTSPTPAPTTAAAIPSVAAISATAVVAPTTTVAPGPRTTTSPATTVVPVVPSGVDDSALFAAAASYSITEKTITDPTLPDATTKTKTVTLAHDGSKAYYANQQELSWDQLATLPTDTEAFRTAIKEPGHPPNAVEKGLQEILQQESPMPLPQRKAAMEVAMTMPGASVTKDAKDADGRLAVEVSIETALMDDRYYFDPVTFQLLEASSSVTPEWVAMQTYVDRRTGKPTPPFGSGFLVLYSDWTITPKS